MAVTLAHACDLLINCSVQLGYGRQLTYSGTVVSWQELLGSRIPIC